jgi:hypothetical protein
MKNSIISINIPILKIIREIYYLQIRYIKEILWAILYDNVFNS